MYSSAADSLLKISEIKFGISGLMSNVGLLSLRKVK